MSDAWNGVPENPERDGWHWLLWGDGRVAPYSWMHVEDAWFVDGEVMGRGWVRTQAVYLGPCLTPAEVAALVAASAEAMREACAKHIEEVREWGGQDYYCDSCKGGAIYPDREDEARRLRALPIPSASALARALAAAKRRGMEKAADMARHWPTGITTNGAIALSEAIRNAAAKEIEG